MRLPDLQWRTLAFLLTLILLIGLGTGTAGAQLPPNARWTTIESQHFRVTFGPGLEELARHAARRAEVAYTRLAAELAEPPAGKIDIVLTDFVDISNGFASPLPTNRITLYSRPPLDLLSLGYFDDWLDLVVTHELAHIFHLDAAGGLGRGLRRVFGRAPVAWPFFPVLGTPTWSVEGLATYIESRLTGAGRVKGSYHEMVLRTAVLEDAFESIDRVNNPSAVWPGRMRSYIYGSLFLDHLSEVYGPEVQRDLIETTASAWIPPFLNFDRIAKKATGKPFTTLYDDWRKELESCYRALADSLRATGVTATERVGQGGYNTLHPRVGPGGQVAYAAMDGRHAAANRILDPATGRSRTISRRNGIGPISWLADGALLTAQLEYDGLYRAYSDLYRIDARGEHRLTEGARLSDPDLAADRRSVVAVQAEGGTNRLVVYDLETGRVDPLTAAEPGVHWAFPRWAPDGKRLAVGRWEAGEYDVVILDSLGTLLHRVSADRALEMAPAWSPDGRYLIFSSDRSGIPNLYAYDLLAGDGRGGGATGGPEGTVDGSEHGAPEDATPNPELFQVTNLLTGAFFPDLSPDGRWIYFSAYHADGFHIERIPFDTAAWRAPAPVSVAFRGDARTGSAGATRLVAAREESTAGGEPGPARPYSPLRSLLPHYWLPTLESGPAIGTFLGAQTGGSDLIGRHAYTASAGYSPSERLSQGHVAYTYAGLAQPILELSAARSWDGSLIFPNTTSPAKFLERDDEFRLTATLRRQRYRSAAWLALGAERARLERSLRDAGDLTLVDSSDHLVGALVRAGFANYRAQPLSLSAEDGISLSLTARRRWDLDPYQHSDGTTRDRGYDEVSGQFTAYKALDLPGYANHVLALRVGTRWRHGPGAATFGVGGASGTELDLGIDAIGGSYRFLPVRGFQENDRRGTFGWSTTLEYRFPLTYIRRGPGLWPIFLDRIAGALFVDAGGAGCGSGTMDPLELCSPAEAGPLVAAGAELIADLSALSGMPLRLRGGTAFPLRGGRTRPELYLLLGLPF